MGERGGWLWWPGSDTYQIAVENGLIITASRTTSRDIKRHKASNYQPG